MEWLTCVRTAIDYMEKHLSDDIDAQDVAKEVFLSPFFLQRGFSLMTGCGIGEYLKSRRLYQAALDLQQTDDKVVDIALRCCYETPESFTKAFSRFHGATPTQVREGAPIRTFLPMTIQLSIQGGNQMDFKITPMFPFKVIGFQKVFNYETAYKEIPKFWDEICEMYAYSVYAGNEPANPYEQALVDNCIGEFGVCIDDLGNGRFRYLIAGKYTGGAVPEGMVLYEFPRGDWAVFNCIGPIPEALQSVNTRIFNEWLPGNPDYELCGNANVEWYDCVNGEKTDADYRSAIWIPVRKKHKEVNVNKKDVVIRPEVKEDFRAVENLIRESFWNVYRPGCLEHYVIHVLRNDPAFVKELDFVMEQDGTLIGQNMFVKTHIAADDGRRIDVLTMGPICITPELKRRGYGKYILDYSLEKAKELGFGAVLFEGNIGFYGKSGFDYARKFGIRYHDLPEGADDSFFLCKELIPGYLDGVTGTYFTPMGYYVDEAEAEAFDQTFPPKEKRKLPGQLFD